MTPRSAITLAISRRSRNAANCRTTYKTTSSCSTILCLSLLKSRITHHVSRFTHRVLSVLFLRPIAVPIFLILASRGNGRIRQVADEVFLHVGGVFRVADVGQQVLRPFGE